MAEEILEKGNGTWQNSIGKFLLSSILPACVVVIGYFIQDKLSEIVITQRLFWTELRKNTSTQSEIQKDLAIAATAIKDHLTHDEGVENNTKTILQDHETRLRAWEAASYQFNPRIKLPQN